MKPPILVAVLITIQESEIQTDEDGEENKILRFEETPGTPIDRPSTCT
jgi:hypothetical protein